MNFATVKGWEIPEGKVAKVADALGNVLWNAVRMANLTITSFWDGMDGDTARITINSPSPFAPNPNEPNNKVTSWTAYVYDLFEQQNRTIKIPVGSTIECYITRDKENADSYIKLNGVNVAIGEGTYVYTVTGDATIDVSEDYIQGDFGVISITGAVTYISFTMNGDTYQAIEGMSWKAWFASDYNTTGETEGTITDANGNEVSMDAVIVEGAVYDVEFGVPCTVTIVAFGMSPNGNANVTLNGQTYSAKGVSITIDQNNPTPIAEITVPSGTVMSCSACTSVGNNKGTIVLNGTDVAKAASAGVPATYDYVVNGNIKVELNDANVVASNMSVSRVLITEQ